MPPTLRLSRLQSARRAVFAELEFSRTQFVRYGGTAVSLQVGHRESEDFDFFSSEPLPDAGKSSVAAALSPLRPRVTQDAEDTVSLEAMVHKRAVRLSFFGGIRLPRLDLPLAASVGPRIASRLDLAGFKLAMASCRHQE